MPDHPHLLVLTPPTVVLRDTLARDYVLHEDVETAPLGLTCRVVAGSRLRINAADSDAHIAGRPLPSALV